MSYGSVRGLGKRLPDDLVNEAVKLRMEGDSYRLIAARLHVKSHTSLEPHLKGIRKGVRVGPTVIEVPVSAKQEPVAETEKPARDMKVGPSDRAVSAVAKATLELATSLRAFKEELAKRSEEGRLLATTGSYAYPGGGVTAGMMEDEINKFKENDKAQNAMIWDAMKKLLERVEVLEGQVAVLMMKSLQ